MDVLRRNHVVVEGSGPRTIVFAHGFGCDQRVWQRVAPSFTGDYRVVLFDYVGGGRSERSAYDSVRYGSLRGYARDLLDVAEALDLDGAFLVGHSVSSMIGALACIEEPRRFQRLVMLAPSPRYLNDPPGYFGGFEPPEIESLLQLMDQNFIGWARTFAQVATTDPVLASELVDSFCFTDPRTARQFAEATFYSDHRADLPKIPVPVLVVQCSDDDIAPVTVGEYTRAHVPRAAYRLLSVSGHMPHMSNPEEVRGVIRDYLAGPAPH